MVTVPIAAELTMKQQLAYIVIALCIQANAFGISLSYVRSEFKKATDNEETAEQLLVYLKKSPERDALIEGYLAATEALMAKYAFLPTTKYSRCSTAMKGFKKAIDMDPANLEIRYLRIAVEINLPSILNMSNDIDTDKKKIFELLPRSTDIQLNRDVARFLIDKKLCTPEQRVSLEKIIN